MEEGPLSLVLKKITRLRRDGERGSYPGLVGDYCPPYPSGWDLLAGYDNRGGCPECLRVRHIIKNTENVDAVILHSLEKISLIIDGKYKSWWELKENQRKRWKEILNDINERYIKISGDDESRRQVSLYPLNEKLVKELGLKFKVPVTYEKPSKVEKNTPPYQADVLPIIYRFGFNPNRSCWTCHEMFDILRNCGDSDLEKIDAYKWIEKIINDKYDVIEFGLDERFKDKRVRGTLLNDEPCPKCGAMIEFEYIPDFKGLGEDWVQWRCKGGCGLFSNEKIED
ncbi:MAG: hypothetical protein ACFFCS_20735 [Candidatus Hodarchaeota archaeon]